MRPRVVSLTQTCGACPSQWEGETDAGDRVYVRYRHGFLSVTIGHAEVLADAIMADGSMGDGYMTLADMKRHTHFVLDWEGSDV